MDIDDIRKSEAVYVWFATVYGYYMNETPEPIKVLLTDGMIAKMKSAFERDGKIFFVTTWGAEVPASKVVEIIM